MIYEGVAAGLIIGFIIGWLVSRQEAVALKASLNAQVSSIQDARTRMSESFGNAATEALKANRMLFIDQARGVLETLIEQSKGDLFLRQEAIAGIVKPLGDALTRYEAYIGEIENKRHTSSGELKAMIEQMLNANAKLENQTRSLTTALKRPEVKGRWGEITLMRVVEVSGMSQYCDFDVQQSAHTEEGRKRPDMIVRLPQGHSIVVDSKAPLDAYMDAIDIEDEVVRKEQLIRHAQKVRQHMTSLSSKEYWKDFSPETEFVVLFLPGESFFSAALEQDRQLIEDGIAKRVILATPTTLIALLRTVAVSWQHNSLHENAKEIGKAGIELFDRLSIYAEHMKKMKDGLQKAVNAFNQATGSWESRVMPSVNRIKDLGGREAEESISSIEHVDGYIKTLKVEREDGISGNNEG
jgi:DNA recombination protein RmuC